MIFATSHFTMTITITAFEHSPDGGKGLARDCARSQAPRGRHRPH
jgi:hypothetical protein